MLIFSILCFKNKLICWTKQTHCVLPVLFWNCLFITDVSEAAFCLCTQRQSKKQWGQANISEWHGLHWTFCLCFVINPWNCVKRLLAIVVVLSTNQVRQLREAVLYGLLNYTSSALGICERDCYKRLCRVLANARGWVYVENSYHILKCSPQCLHLSPMKKCFPTKPSFAEAS